MLDFTLFMSVLSADYYLSTKDIQKTLYVTSYYVLYRAVCTTLNKRGYLQKRISLLYFPIFITVTPEEYYLSIEDI